MKKIFKTYWLLVLVASLVIVLDQVTKFMVRSKLAFGEGWTPISAIPFFRIVHWANTGAAFGIFQSGGLIFGVLALVVSIIIVIYYPKLPENYVMLRIALAMQLGGALGNLIDRVRFGTVTDFIAVGAFPVFNIADASITVGVGILLLNLWLIERQEKAQASKKHNDLQEESEHCSHHET